jgi:hypothetical protein
MRRPLGKFIEFTYSGRFGGISHHLNLEADHKPFIKEVVKVCTKRLQTLEMCKERQWV